MHDAGWERGLLKLVFLCNVQLKFCSLKCWVCWCKKRDFILRSSEFKVVKRNENSAFIRHTPPLYSRIVDGATTTEDTREKERKASACDDGRPGGKIALFLLSQGRKYWKFSTPGSRTIAHQQYWQYNDNSGCWPATIQCSRVAYGERDCMHACLASVMVAPSVDNL